MKWPALFSTLCSMLYALSFSLLAFSLPKVHHLCQHPVKNQVPPTIRQSLPPCRGTRMACDLSALAVVTAVQERRDMFGSIKRKLRLWQTCWGYRQSRSRPNMSGLLGSDVVWLNFPTVIVSSSTRRLGIASSIKFVRGNVEVGHSGNRTCEPPKLGVMFVTTALAAARASSIL
jgi:hypothetical protein